MPHLTTEKLRREDLLQYFFSGAKPLTAHKIGIEYETFGLLENPSQPLPFYGSPGVQEILNNIATRYSWDKTYENNNIIELTQGQKSITLEPGGQVELSSSPCATLHELSSELEDYIEQLLRASENSAVSWMALGVHPFAALDAIPWVPKGRYAILSRWLGKTGTLGHRMMKQTASVQVNLDYENEMEALQKFRLLTALAPLFTALFANSSIYEGKITPFVSYRARVWQDTDPGRCGLIRRLFDPHYSFEEYLDWVLKIPMLFLERDGKWIATEGLDFAQYLEKGFGNYRATLEDWELHLSTIFTEVRLKRVLELRSVDSNLPQMALGVAALATGLLYDSSARAAAWDLIKDWSWEERLRIYREVPKYGLLTAVKNGTIISIVDALMEISVWGLKRRAQFLGEESEVDFLAPVKEQISKGITRAQEGAETFQKSPREWLEQNKLKRKT